MLIKLTVRLKIYITLIKVKKSLLNNNIVRASAASAWTLIMLGIRGSDPQTDPKDPKRFIYLSFVECG